MGRPERIVFRFAETTPAGGSGQERTIQFPGVHGGAAMGGVTFQRQIWYLTRVHFVRTAGSAATYRLRMGSAATFAADSIDEFLVSVVTAVGTKLNDVFVSPIPVRLDANGRLYFRPGWDAGADNVANVEFWFEKAQGGG